MTESSDPSTSDVNMRRRVRIRDGNEGDDDEETSNERRVDREGDATETMDEDDLSMVKRRKLRRARLERTRFSMINDRVVEDITMDFFYKPHTLTVLIFLCLFLIYKAIYHSNKSTEVNVFDGCMGTLTLFLVVSALAFPNGPFIRPHPVVWRVGFGLSVAYALLLQFTVFQSFADVKKVLTWLDPEGLSRDKLVEKEYAVNCSDLTFERFWGHVDIFAVGHFLGWTMKALLIRHGIICWYISIIWELTEVVFTHLLPNFQECWWDALILDVLICNGLGIFVGLKMCDFFEMRTFHWESIKDIQTTRGKVKRAVLQFTPESFSRFDWFSGPALRRMGSLFIFVLIWLFTELNTFFIKHIFAVDTAHPVVFWRIILIGVISAPSIRQFYEYTTDPFVKRLGMQCWVYCAVTALEAAVCLKFGRQMFPPVQLTWITAWIAILVVGTFASVWLSVWWGAKMTDTVEEKVGKQTRLFYVDSSYENLGIIQDDVRERRKQLRIASESEALSE